MNRQPEEIRENVKQLLEELPPGITLVAAAKDRTNDEVQAAIEAGISYIGHNYVQEAQPMIETLGDRARWHMIGHLQRNKVKYAIHLFHMIESLDSWRLAKEIEKRCAREDLTMPVLVEVNSGEEDSKYGIMPDQVDEFVKRLGDLQHLDVQGLMTMGPRFGDPEKARPYFQLTREAFERLSALDLPNVQMRFLSMGMSNTYQVAMEEGANMVRIGTRIFGDRPD
jgi:hypothetical protein